MSRNVSPEPADVAWAGIITGALAVDVWLARQDHALLTHRVQTPAGMAGLSLLVGHFLGVLPRWADPFALVRPVADWHPITRSETDA